METVNSSQSKPQIVALDASFQVDDTERILLHVDALHYIVLCDSDGLTRIFEADTDGQIAGWMAYASGLTLEDALEKLAARQDLPSRELLSAVVQVRVLQRLRSARLARGRPVPTRPGFMSWPLVGDASLRPGPSLHMGRTSTSASTPGKSAELALDFAPEVYVGPFTDVRPTTTLDPPVPAQRRRFVTTLADTR
jgi:hypothetical protein